MSQLSDLLNKLNEPFDWSTRDIDARANALGYKLNFTTVARYLAGNHGRPSPKVIAAFAAVFNTSENRLRAAADMPPTNDRFELPPEADQLDPDERRAVVNLVRVMAKGKGNADTTTDTPQEQGAQGQEQGEKTGIPDDELERARRASQTPPWEINQMAAKRKTPRKPGDPGNES